MKRKKQCEPESMSLLAATNELTQDALGLFKLAKGSGEFKYSDGTQSEVYLRKILETASDLSSTSLELRENMVDWPSEYHLSPKRANLLRGINLDKVTRVLELGCGCGAITRYLGELGIEIDAIEGSATRAELTALRCRDLPNVSVVTANFNDLAFPDNSYDAVLLIGVAEYAKRFCDLLGSDEDAVIALLRTAWRAIKSTGFVAVAIENRVGLKYLFGAHEDHHGKRYIGISGYHDSSGVRTYSKSEWELILKRAGITHVRFLYPFPDYKLPTVILSDSYVQNNPYAYCHLDGIRARDYFLPLELDFSETMCWQSLNGGQTLGQHANSFLMLLAKDDDTLNKVCENDFAHLPEFIRPLSLTCIVRKKTSSDHVERVRLDHTVPPTTDLGGIIQKTGSEPFICGTLLSILWFQSLLIEENLSRFAVLLREYYKFLCDKKEEASLSIDLLPSNIIVTQEGKYREFDQEWEVVNEITADYLFFRALMWFALRYHQRQALLVIQRHKQIYDVRSFITYGFQVAGVSITDDVLGNYADQENKFQTKIKGARSEPILLDTPLIGQRPPPMPTSRIYWRAGNESYREDRCVLAQAATDSEQQVLSFDLPADANSMTHFRFDPCEVARPEDFGFMHLHRCAVAICAGDDELETIWKIEEDQNIAKAAKLSGIAFHHASLGSVFAIIDDDPWIEFGFVPRKKPLPNQYFRVSLVLQVPRTEDYILARDRYLVREEIMTRRLNYLETRLANKEALESELAAIKQSRVWRWAEQYRELVYLKIKPHFDPLLRIPRTIDEYGIGGVTKKLIARLRRTKAGEELRRQAARTPYERWLDARNVNVTISDGPLISVVMPVYNVAPEILQQAISSVQSQTYPNWELCIADDCSTRRATRRYLERLEDPRIKIKFLEKNLNIAGASNEALSLATGDYVALLDNDDELAAQALAAVVDRISTTGADVIYSDEDFIKTDGHLDYPHFKPDYSPDLLLSHNYITHLLVIKRDLINDVGGFRSGYDGAQDYDLLLRVVEHAKKIEHIAEPLYHWRMTKNSTSLDPSAKPHTHDNGKRAVSDALSRRDESAIVLDGNLPNYYRVKRRITGTPLVSIVIPFKDKPGLLEQAIDSILSKSTYQEFEIIGVSNNTITPTTYDLMRQLKKRDTRIHFLEKNIPFSFSRLVNSGVHEAKGEHIVLFNNDIEIITPEWIESFLEHSQRKEVAVVGAKLYYPNNTIQHAGVALGLGGYAGHIHKDFPAYATGYFNRLNVIQNVSALTAALFMVKRALYLDLDGFDDENFEVAYNDVDFCLRAREKGYLNIFTPYVEAYHHESISRGYEDTPQKQKRFEVEKNNLRERHRKIIYGGDPYYNPNLNQGKDDFSL